MKSYAAGFLLAVTVLQNPCCVQAQPISSPTTVPVTASVAADGARNQAKRKPRFTIPLGKGWSVCESYARFLNAQPEDEPLPLCHLKLGPDFMEPNWEELDIADSLPIVYAIENPSYPASSRRLPFDEWKASFDLQLKENRSPRLRRTRLALIEGGSLETILAYEADRNACDKEVKKRGYSDWGDGAKLMLWDSQANKVNDYDTWFAFMPAPTKLIMYHGRPLMLRTVWGYEGDHPGKSGGNVAGRIHVRHFSPAPTGNANPYTKLERCHIRFDLAPEIFERMTK